MTGIVPIGTTGESPTITRQEARKLIEIAVEEAAGKVIVMAGTGSNCTASAVEHTQIAKEAGADCCLVVSPYYNKPTPEGLIMHYTEIAKVQLPIIVYNIKGRTGINIETDTLMELAKNEYIVGVKEASGDLQQMKEVIEGRPDDFTVLSGDDSLTLDLMKMGGDGVISVASNIIPDKISHLVSLALNHQYEDAEKLNYELMRLFKEIFVETNPLPIKYAAYKMKKCGLNFRLPMCPPTQNTKHIIDQMLIDYNLI